MGGGSSQEISFSLPPLFLSVEIFQPHHRSNPSPLYGLAFLNAQIVVIASVYIVTIENSPFTSAYIYDIIIFTFPNAKQMNKCISFILLLLYTADRWNLTT